LGILFGLCPLIFGCIQGNQCKIVLARLIGLSVAFICVTAACQLSGYTVKKTRTQVKQTRCNKVLYFIYFWSLWHQLLSFVFCGIRSRGVLGSDEWEFVLQSIWGLWLCWCVCEFSRVL